MKKILILFTIVPFVAFSQTDWEEIKPEVFIKAIQEFEESISLGESYSLETSYNIFKNYSDDVPVKSFVGKLTCRYGNELNVSQMGFIMVQDDKLNLTIDTINQQIIIQHPDSTFFYRKTVSDISSFSEIAEIVYRKETLGKTLFSLELKKGNPYHAIELEFLGKEMISRIIIYSNQPYSTEDYMTETDKAKIVINFTNFKKGKEVNLKSFKNISDFIIIKDLEFQAIGKYKDFELIDLRN